MPRCVTAISSRAAVVIATMIPFDSIVMAVIVAVVVAVIVAVAVVVARVILRTDHAVTVVPLAVRRAGARARAV